VVETCTASFIASSDSLKIIKRLILLQQKKKENNSFLEAVSIILYLILNVDF
jgi:hypothetical protein